MTVADMWFLFLLFACLATVGAIAGAWLVQRREANRVDEIYRNWHSILQ